jgi:single-strand DNA-binding protein
MPNFSRIVVCGHIGRDPEVRYTADGKPVANFSVAYTERGKNKDGDRTEQTTWYRVVVFDKTAEIAERYLHKGDAVLVEGRMLSREYVGKDGEKKTAWEIRGDKIVLLGAKRDGAESAPAAKLVERPSTKQEMTGDPFADMENDVI